MKTNIISNVIAKNKIRKSVLQKAYSEIGYFRTPTFQKVINIIPSIVGPMAAADAYILSSAINHSPNMAQGVFFGGVGFASYIFRNVAVKAHKEAVDGASKLGSQLIEKGFNRAERKVVIKDKLSSGNPIFSNLFKIVYPKRVEKLADGIPTKTGFINI